MRHMLARESWRGSSCRGLHALPSCQPGPDAQSSTASAQVFQLVLRSTRRRLGGTLASGHLLRCLLADAARNRWQERRTARRARLRQLRACSAGPSGLPPRCARRRGQPEPSAKRPRRPVALVRNARPPTARATWAEEWRGARRAPTSSVRAPPPGSPPAVRSSTPPLGWRRRTSVVPREGPSRRRCPQPQQRRRRPPRHPGRAPSPTLPRAHPTTRSRRRTT
mmetsp:Transcript_11594/g.38320  ORF Transcript_11594/g.38320 Transcript_11594/m.38320 type:complete len:223 (-) Transcript_11594:323-991(-)